MNLPNEILAGGDVDERQSKYFASKDALCDLYLTSFQTLHRDWDKVQILLKQRGVRFYFVVDEAHYIKQIEGAWASAVQMVACHANYRCVLTGTPFPKSLPDAFNLFDVLWPNSSPISQDDRTRIEYLTQKNMNDEARNILDSAIGPLFYRVRKSELGLAPQTHAVIALPMNRYERLVYDSVLDRIRVLSESDYAQNRDLILRLRRGRMIRLRQCLSFTKLLGSAVLEYNEDLLQGGMSLADIIRHYEDLETPRKLEQLLLMVKRFMQEGEKVVIWSNFIESLRLIHRHIRQAGYEAELIYGGTPVQRVTLKKELTREEIIANFVDPCSGLDVLIANPAACAESISLHKTCSNAVYYDVSYNCAQYLQSLDRIHRVGGSENKISHYHFLQYEDTIDQDILSNVQRKAQNMSAIIDKDYAIYDLDMFAEDEDLQAYERLFPRHF